VKVDIPGAVKQIKQVRYVRLFIVSQLFVNVVGDRSVTIISLYGYYYVG